MRIVADFHLQFEPKRGSGQFAALQSALAQEGWQVETTYPPGQPNVFGQRIVRCQEYSHPRTPLLIYARATQECDDPSVDYLDVVFVEKWWRCTLRGGWIVVGYLPEDIMNLLLERIRAGGFSVTAMKDPGPFFAVR